MATGRLPDPNTAPLTAKGDLYTYSTVPARLAVGSNGDTLVADSSASTGLRWQPSQAAGRNAIINGGMDIWQRGTSFTTNYAYTADRWAAGADAGTFTVSRSTDAPSTFTYSLSMAGTNTTSAQIYQLIESQNSAHMAGQTVTLSVYAKSTVGSAGLAWLTQIPGATDNWSSPSTDQSGTFTASVSGSWTRYSATFTVGANATRGYKIIIYRNVSATSTTTLYTGIQLELGSVATTFTRAGGTLAGEFEACARYYYRATGTQAYTCLSHLGSAETTTLIRFTLPVPTQMRVAPTSVDFSTLTSSRDGLNTGNAVSAIALSAYSGKDAIQLAATVTGATQYSPYYIYTNNSAAGFIGVSAEL